MTAQTSETRDPDNEQVSRNVRAELARSSMTQAELAGIMSPQRDRSWIADRLNGRAEWRVVDVTAVARALGCTTEALLRGLSSASTLPTTED